MYKAQWPCSADLVQFLRVTYNFCMSISFSMANLKICTYNVRGLRQSKKRRQVFSYLHRSKTDIYLLQETHSVMSDENYWQNEWGGKIVFCHGSSTSRGVCILFHPTLDFIIHRCEPCNNGRLLIIEATVKKKFLTLVCLYGPNNDDSNFFDSLLYKLCDYHWDSLFIGGDFNFVFNLDLDKAGGNPQTNFKARDKCLEVMSSLNVVDIWRERNPHQKSFTWSSNITPGIHCRLDFFLISRNLINYVVKNNVTTGLNSDHSIVILDVQICDEKRGPGFWKFNNSLLHDTRYIEMITDLIIKVTN